MEIGIPMLCLRILRVTKLNAAEDTYVFVLQYIVRLVTTGLLNIKKQVLLQPVPVVARSNALVCCRWPAEIVVSNLTGGMDLGLLRVLRVAR
jgi:hypothetical protein